MNDEVDNILNDNGISNDHDIANVNVVIDLDENNPDVLVSVDKIVKLIIFFDGNFKVSDLNRFR